MPVHRQVAHRQVAALLAQKRDGVEPHDDLVGRLLEAQAEAEKQGLAEYDAWEVIRFPAIAEEDELYRKAGEPLWPEKFPLPVLPSLPRLYRKWVQPF